MNKHYNNHPKILELERAVLLYPEDIEARLVYADALEEFAIPFKYPGLERAEFIRTQIELEKYGKPRKKYNEGTVESFTTNRNTGACYLEGIPDLRVGERIDLTLLDDDTVRESTLAKNGGIERVPRRHRIKKDWYGLLVTEIRHENSRLHRYSIEFKMDEQSRPWPGDPLREKLGELFRLGDARGDLPLPPHNSVTGGLHTNPTGQPFTTEIWPSQPGGTTPAILPRWRFLWRNGFIEQVGCSADDWQKYGAYMVGYGPIREAGPFGYPAFELAWARREAKLDRPCPFCEGKGTTLGAGPDRGNPTCTDTSGMSCADCKGSGWITS